MKSIFIDGTMADAEKMTDAEIKKMSYGIKYFDYNAAMITPTEENHLVCRYLVGRLREIEAATVKPVPVEIKLVKCSCGCTVPAGQVMSASMGSSCPDCYDRMSD